MAVIINDSSQTSIDIGNYFQQQRNIPNQNMIHITATTNEELDSLEFEQIRQQIETYLTANNLIDSINYIVTTKGVPLKVQRGNCNDLGTGNANCTSFDNEIALILGTLSSFIAAPGMISNPYYNTSSHFSRSNYGIYLVTRLDGYTKNDVINLIDRSSSNTLVNKSIANFIFDLSYEGSSLQIATFTAMLEAPYDSLIADGWNAVLDTDTTYLINQQNVLGYYSINYKPANKVLNFTWEKGSIAEMLFDFTANTFYDSINTNNDLLIANLISKGATGANGYTYYIFKYASLKANILFDRYTDTSFNYNLAESYYMSIPKLSWQNVIIGDPKTSIIIDNPIAINENSFENNIVQIYPNPTTGRFTLEMDLQKNTSLSIKLYQITGQQIFAEEVRHITGAFSRQIDLNNYAKGLYYVQVVTDEGVSTGKVIYQ